MRKVSVGQNIGLIKGKQVRILYELVTVFCKQKLQIHWETGKGADAMSDKPGDLPFAVQERKSSGHEELAVRNEITELYMV